MNKQLRLVAVLFFSMLFALGAACGGSSEPEAEPSEVPPTTAYTATPPPVESARTGDEELAPELRGINSWINSEPFTLKSQRGKVVLIDFWTYTCVNCIRTLPYLKEWHDKYADAGLVIVGVHAPEFEFEKLRQNVVDAVGEFDIRYPVAQDNDFQTWRAYNNRFWPAKYLIDRDGYIRYTHFGEGAYDETEERIRDLLAEAGTDLSGIVPNTDPGPEIDPIARQVGIDMSITRELYAGYERNFGALAAFVQGVNGAQPPYVFHDEYYQSQDADILYSDTGGHHNQFIHLEGLWRNESERLIHARETENYEDYIAIIFYGTSVNAVMAPKSSTPFRVRLTIEDAPIIPEQAGDDVMFDADGNSFVLVDEARMYRLVNLSEFSGHDLKLSSNSPEFSLFAFTFGAYKGGEPDS